jgi:hypothetical protein
MYVLTSRRRDEFLACPPLVRMGKGTDPPVLMLKTTTPSAKHLLRSDKLRVAVIRVRTCFTVVATCNDARLRCYNADWTSTLGEI